MLCVNESFSRAINCLRSGEQASRAARLAPFLAFDLREPRLHQFLDECSRQWLVRWEVDRPFRCGEALKLLLECLDHRRGREQTAMVRKCGEPYQHSFLLKRRNPIADGLSSFRGHGGSNRRAKLVQSAAGRFRDASEVFLNVFRSVVAFRSRTAIAGFLPTHSSALLNISVEVTCDGSHKRR